MNSSSDSTSPHENDVLFGRGAGTRTHRGNKQFLEIVAQHKEEYASSTATYERKVAIVREILNRIKSQGKFLAATGDSWCEVADNKAIAKIKQALREPDRSGQREHHHAGTPANGFPPTSASLLGPLLQRMPISHTGNTPWSSALPLFSNPQLQYQLVVQQAIASSGAVPLGSASMAPGNAPITLQSLGGTGLLPLGLPMIGVPVRPQTPSLLEARLAQLLFVQQGDQAAGGRATSLQAPPTQNSLQGEVLSGTAGVANCNRTTSLLKRSFSQDAREKRERDRRERDKILANLKSHAQDSDDRAGVKTRKDGVDSEDVEAAQFLLSTMTESITQAMAELKRQESLTTEEERDEAIADIFGSLCEISQSKKRLKLAPVETEISVLLEEMKRELDTRPSHEKLAFSEAREAALPIEFSDRRLEIFLRHENMNARRAAERFVTYWEERRKLFGPEKFHLPMTLKGALRDDHECLLHGPLVPMPALDQSGRMMEGYIMKWHFGENYDSQSLLRVFWFYSELQSKHPNATKGVVRYMDMAHASLWDFDLDFMRTSSYWEKNAIPVPIRATHVCCVPYILSTVAKPMTFSNIDRHLRIRIVIHDCPPEKTAEALAEYGIPSQVVSTELGGKCDIAVERKKWFAQLKKMDEQHALDADEFVWWEL